MTTELFAQEDILSIRAGSKDFNDKKTEINETVRIALGLVAEEVITSLKRGAFVMNATYNGILWEVRRERDKLQACAFRLGHVVNFLYNSNRDVKIPFEEYDSLCASLPVFLNGFAKRFPFIYNDLTILRAVGRMALKAKNAKRSCGSSMHFMLSKKIKAGHFNQLGYVVAFNGAEAAKELNLQIVPQQEPNAGTFLDLVDTKGNEYTLDLFHEITGPIES